MGYGTRGGVLGHSIRTFEPDDTDKEFFIANEASLTEIQERIKAKWPDADPSSIGIEPQHIHTDCLGYDRYDPGDYTNYLRIYIKE